MLLHGCTIKLTTLVIQQVVLFKQLPVHQEALRSAGWVKDTRVFAQKLLEAVQFGLTRLFNDKHNDCEYKS